MHATADAMKAAFVADVVAHPADDAPRLVYADWLEDNGEPERAAFIRVQIALAEREKEPGRPTDRMVLAGRRIAEHTEHAVIFAPAPGECPCEMCLLERERELLEANRSAWLADSPCKMDAWSLDEPMLDYVYGVRCRFRRGFVAEVCASLDALREHLPAIVKRHPIERAMASDKKPAKDFVVDDSKDDRHSWRRFQLAGRPAGEQDLPPEVWDRMGGHLNVTYVKKTPFWKGYPTFAAAQDALSAALLSLARGGGA